MKSQTLCDAQAVVEQQAEAMEELRLLQVHPTVQMNPKLRAGVQKAWQCIAEANAYACLVWFRRDTHADVQEFLPPLDAA